MDAKDRARFINSLNETGGQPGVEPAAAAGNPSGAPVQAMVGNPPVAPVQAAAGAASAPVFKAASPGPSVVAAVQDDEESVFALGLPAWDIVPPQVVVRRKRRI